MRVLQLISIVRTNYSHGIHKRSLFENGIISTFFGRTRIVPQSVVTNLNYGLFTMGNLSDIFYSVLIYHPPESRELWGSALHYIWTNHVKWMFEADHVNGLLFPDWFSNNDEYFVELKKIILSRFPTWHAVRSKVQSNNGPLPPIVKAQSLLQYYCHNINHLGVDETDDDGGF